MFQSCTNAKDYLPSNFSTLKPFLILDQKNLFKADDDSNIDFPERKAIDKDENRIFELDPCPGKVISKDYKSNCINDNGFLRANVSVLMRLQQLRELVLYPKDEKITNINNCLLKVGTEIPKRYIPPSEVITESQAQNFIKEMIALTMLYNGIQTLTEEFLNILVDIGIQFLLNLGADINKEKENLAQADNEVSKKPYERKLLALLNALKHCGCEIEDLSLHLTRIVRYGDKLRAIDRKLLKKGSKNLNGKQIEKTDNTISNVMIEALTSLQPGAAYSDNKFCFNGLDISLPTSINKVDFDPQKTIKRNINTSTNLAESVKRKQVKKETLNTIDIQSNKDLETKSEIPILSSYNQEIQINSEITETELDLSNLDAFFDGDDILGDDMLPSIF